MINLNKKRKILLLYRQGYNKSEISREVSVARKTVRKYINEYEEKLEQLGAMDHNNEEQLNALIESLSEPPKYDTSNRSCLKLTEEVKAVINSCLEENDEKLKNHNRKQLMKVVDIHELLIEQGYDIGYTTVNNYVKTQKKAKEAYIKQIYPLGETLEYDWGEVKLEIAGVAKRFQMALMTTAAGSCHFAMLYHNQKMESFLDSHIKGLNYFGGVFKEIVYDNMKVAVGRFVSKGKNEPTEDLFKLSMYYGFDYRFCNARRGNEKGHVERGIEFVRRKAFAKKYKFNTFEEANTHLLKVLEDLNRRQRHWLDNKSPWDILTQEQQHMISLKPDYVIAKKLECRVDKYSTITVEQNRYSVPEYLVGKFVEVIVYSNKLKVNYKHESVAHHNRSFGHFDWTMDINHYLNTIKKKPGSLKNSAAIQCSERRIQEIYNTYYTGKPKDFVVLLEIIKEKDLESVESAIEELTQLGSRHVTTENINNLVHQVSAVNIEHNKDSDDEIKKRSWELLDKLTIKFLEPENGRSNIEQTRLTVC